MKLFLVSVANSNGTDPRVLFFVNAFNKFKGLEIVQSGIPKLGVPNVEIAYDDWTSVPAIFRQVSMSSLRDLKVAVDEFTNRLAISRSCPVTANIQEVTGDMRQWFLTWGSCDLVARVLNTFGLDYDKGVRLEQVTSSMRDRYHTLLAGHPTSNPLATRKGIHYRQASNYLFAKKFCKDMAALIAESIKEDTDMLSGELMPDYDLGTLHNLILENAHRVLVREGVPFEVRLQACGHWEYQYNASEVNIGRGRTRMYCQHCVEDDEIVIETYDSGILMLRDEAHWCDRNEEYYETEPEYDDDDDNDGDYHSDHSSDTGRLMSYSTNVLDILDKDASFTSSPFGEFHMGVELELVTNGSVSAAVDDLRNKLGEDYIICKSDGSLPDGGVEIVTAPRKLTDHITRFSAWEIDSNYRAWNTGKCGMHVHVDSRAFTRLTLGKFLVLINDSKNAEFIRKIAGRHPHIDTQAQTYCAAEGQQSIENPSKALKGKSSNRYQMVNTTCLRGAEADRLGVRHVGERSFNTIELRVFRASLKKDRLLAQIEFTHACIMFCRVASMRDLNGIEFLKWLKSTDNRYPHLSDWYGIRRRVGAKNSAPAENACADKLSV